MLTSGFMYVSGEERVVERPSKQWRRWLQKTSGTRSCYQSRSKSPLLSCGRTGRVCVVARWVREKALFSARSIACKSAARVFVDARLTLREIT